MRSIAGTTVDIRGGTINGNMATEGAGIYLAEGSTLNLSGTPSFGGTGTEDPNGVNPAAAISGPRYDADGFINNGNYCYDALNDAYNGQQAYHEVRQDIYVAGYVSQGGAANSIVVTDAIDMVPGSVWVWCEEREHYEMLKQFAVFESAAVKNALINNGRLESTMRVFRNAQADQYTGCGADYLTGQEGDNINGLTCIYWTGGFGYRKVILRKINTAYASVKDRTFKVYKGTGTTPYIVKVGDTKTQLGGTVAPDGVTLAPMVSSNGGVFWIGVLPYGWYVIEETEPHKFFYVAVTAKGVFGTPQTVTEDGTEKEGGYDRLSSAQAAAKAVYDANK